MHLVILIRVNKHLYFHIALSYYSCWPCNCDIQEQWWWPVHLGVWFQHLQCNQRPTWQHPRTWYSDQVGVPSGKIDVFYQIVESLKV